MGFGERWRHPVSTLCFVETPYVGRGRRRGCEKKLLRERERHLIAGDLFEASVSASIVHYWIAFDRSLYSWNGPTGLDVEKEMSVFYSKYTPESKNK